MLYEVIINYIRDNKLDSMRYRYIVSGDPLTAEKDAYNLFANEPFDRVVSIKVNEVKN